MGSRRQAIFQGRCHVHIVVLALVLLGLASSATAQVDTSIVPAPGRTTWAPGLRRPIPARSRTCARISPPSGGADASTIINAAIAACPLGQTVQLTAGTFIVNNHILVNKGITLRGAGPDRTKLVKTNGAIPLDYRVPDAQPLIVMGPSRWPRVAEATATNLSADAIAGSYSVTVDAAQGFAPGQFVVLDEDDYSTASWLAQPSAQGQPARKIWASDRLVFQLHDPPEQFVDDPFPASLTWFSRAGRPLNEIKEIVSVNGREITFSTPIHITYTRERFAQLTRFEQPHLTDAGVEDLYVEGGGNGNIRVEAAAYSWVKNIESVLWVGEGVAVNHSFRVELRDSFIHDTAWPYPGGAGYALSMAFASSEVLVENNTILNVNKVMVVRSSGAASVVGYNYMDNGFILSDTAWVEVGLNASHQVGGHHVLFEGNQSFNYDSDNTHGNAIAMTVFRNHLVGRRRDFNGMANARSVGLMFGSWWHSFIGNVLGKEGWMNTWTLEDPGDGTYGSGTLAWGNSPFVWKLGYDPTRWEQTADPKVRQTALRDGNYDYLTNRVTWDRPSRSLPASLYLTSKPAFFGRNDPWPWVEPLTGRRLGTLPAAQRRGIGPPLYVTPPPR